MIKESAKATLKVLSVSAAVAATLLFGCKEEAKPAKQAAPQAPKAQKAGPAQDTAAAARPEEKKVESETYPYNPGGRRDPFLSIIEAAKQDREAEKKKKGLRPSEAYDMGEIKVIAIASDRKNRYAMVQFPDNRYFTVKVGTTLGRYGGKVVKVDRESVVVREYVKDYRGETQARDTILKLRKEEGE